ncbi:MAG TPA: DUF4124 domain-containing protein [Usitatibacter sp.]|jgi:hypothetical protein
MLSLPAAAAGIYRCTSPTGGVTYQETACDGSTSGGLSGIPTSFPEVNTTERDRLLRQVALLEDRELKRYEIDSRERVAQSDIAAREREAQAAMSAQSSDAYGGPYYFAGGGGRLIPIMGRQHNVQHHGGNGAGSGNRNR